jgi:hypothetical protein
VPHLATYVGLADHSEQVLAESLREVARGHARVADVHHLCLTLAGMSERHRERLAPVVARYGEQGGGQEDVDEPERLRADALPSAREGEIGLLRDLQDLHLLATLVESTWVVIAQGAQALRDRELLEVSDACRADTARQLSWLTTRMTAAAPQALVVAP